MSKKLRKILLASHLDECYLFECVGMTQRGWWLAPGVWYYGVAGPAYGE